MKVNGAPISDKADTLREAADEAVVANEKYYSYMERRKDLGYRMLDVSYGVKFGGRGAKAVQGCKWRSWVVLRPFSGLFFPSLPPPLWFFPVRGQVRSRPVPFGSP